MRREDELQVRRRDAKLCDNRPGRLLRQGFRILAGGVGAGDVVFDDAALTDAALTTLLLVALYATPLG